MSYDILSYHDTSVMKCHPMSYHYASVGFVKAMGNTYGILLITVLMGNGLVGLPRRMWFYADTEGELNLLYMMVNDL